MNIDVKVNAADAQARIAAMLARAQDLKPVMKAFGNHMLKSVQKNFDVGGRPIPWDPLKSIDVFPKGTRRSKKYPNRRIQGGRRLGGPLVLTGDLEHNIGFTPLSDDLVLWAAPKNDPIKAPVHQFGTRDGRIPARPYLVFQQEDVVYFTKLAEGYIRVGLAS